MEAVLTEGQRRGAVILSSHIDAITWDEAVDRLQALGQARRSSYVCICNVHSVVTAWQDPAFRRVLNEAEMATPDGAPVAWALRILGFAGQQRINGPDLMWRFCGEAARDGTGIFLYGSTEGTLARLRARLEAEFPGLRVSGTYSPPFRKLSAEEDAQVVEMINRSGAGVVFVGLGCPKQETWMADHYGQVRAVMVGVGAAFDYFAGTVQRAPIWMQRGGMEWIHRLASEPRRLWKRYLVTNTLFLAGFAGQILRQMFGGRGL
ncbi:MAG: WecB/TagA/CpsF family glycosyltransferase [Betaproteobacteria bacterium]|nr:WecB/TagA/CpsF family glycosyltransferase [Betaproteobacteria bacterium]